MAPDHIGVVAFLQSRDTSSGVRVDLSWADGCSLKGSVNNLELDAEYVLGHDVLSGAVSVAFIPF